MGEDREAHLVPALAPHLLLEPRDGLEVVVEDFRSGLDDAIDQLVAAVEVGGQDLDGRPGPTSDGVRRNGRK